MRRAFTALEVLIAMVLVTVVGLAITALTSQGNREAVVSERTMLAEALAQRVLADAMSLPWDELADRLPVDRPVSEYQVEDAALALARPELARQYAGLYPLRVWLEIREVRPGLVAYEVAVSWPITTTRDHETPRRVYTLLRLRTRKDLAIQADLPMGWEDPQAEEETW